MSPISSSLSVIADSLLGWMLLPLWLAPISDVLSLLHFRRLPAKRESTAGVLPRLLILIPAHNEELLVGDCIKSLVAMNYPAARRRILAIADNCDDATAKIVREAGGECIERTDTSARGKPHAIAWALRQTDVSEYDACVIVDADSIVARDYAMGLAAIAPLNDIVFQPNNLVANEFESWLTRLGGLLGRARFEVTNPLKQSARLNCPIANGMGIGTNVLARGGWRSFSITEDSELYAIYTIEGVRIVHARTANIYSQEARSLEQGGTQRQRWTSGRIGILWKWRSAILRSTKIGWRQKLDLVVELGFASPVLHLIVVAFVTAAALVLTSGTPRLVIVAAALASLLSTAVTTIVTLFRHPQPWQTLEAFAMLPLYAAWRVVIFASSLFSLRDTRWRRTARSAPQAA